MAVAVLSGWSRDPSNRGGWLPLDAGEQVMAASDRIWSKRQQSPRNLGQEVAGGRAQAVQKSLPATALQG